MYSHTPVLNIFVSILYIMLVENLEVLDRKLESFTAETTEGGLNLSGEYSMKIKNIGKGPVPKSTIEVLSLSIGVGNDIIQENTTSIGRLRSGDSKTVSFEFDQEVDNSPENRQIARRGCSDQAVEISVEETISALLFIKKTEVTGGVDVSSDECDIESPNIVPDPPDQPVVTPPVLPPDETPEPEPPEPEPPDDENGDQGGGGNDDTEDEQDNQDSEDNGDTEDQPVQQVDINGPQHVRTGQTYTYTTESEPDGVEVYQWRSTAGESRTSSDNEYQLTFDEVDNETVGVSAVNEGSEIIAEGEMPVVVVADDASEARDSDTPITGRRFVPTNETSVYSWSTFPDDTVSFNWQLLSDSEDFNGNASIELQGLSDGTLNLIMESDTAENFLIVIAAIGPGGEVTEQVQKPISVVQVG